MYTYKDTVILHIKKVTKNILLIISILFIVWLFASFIDVNINNMGDYDYACWNLFSIIFSSN